MVEDPGGLPRRQRVAAYAVIVRAGEVLLSRLAPSISEAELWTLPGGGIEFGEHPDDAVVREVHEETGLECHLGRPLWIGSAHRVVDRTSAPTEMHSVRIVYDAWVAAEAPEPRVVEIDGSTVDARWLPVADVESGLVPTVPMVREALAHHWPAERQRLAAYALVRRDDALLLTRHSARGPRPGTWTLPGGGLDHGEPPAVAVAREVLEETGLVATVGNLLGVHDEHFTGTAPHGREEDFHGVHLVFAVDVSDEEPNVEDLDGTTDAVAWVPLAEVTSGAVLVSTLVTAALGMGAAR
ncbi:NUDIX domain-containing protein [Marmoricola sp. URHB0036]|uniref:NUDIX hydrolase n=1 Tax=Marmoricola sp. URHB0036 TaxID=1298863 RepID=UPI0003F9DB6B|nr:NUDIX domain-containing protein [Marmoricola sp. URHB0036]